MVMSEKIWDFWAKHYDRLWVQRVSLGPTRDAIIDNLPKGDSGKLALLDMGCGTGQLMGSLLATPTVAEVDYRGVDQSRYMIAEAQRKYPFGTFITSSSEDYDGEEGFFDVIVCAHSFPYFEDHRKMMLRFRSMLKDDGCLIIAQASMNTIYDRIVLSTVKLTTSSASYYSRVDMRSMVDGIFKVSPVEIRINPAFLMPSIFLFKWDLSEGDRA